MSDQLLTPEELDLIEEGFHAGTEIGRELAERLIVCLRAAWAERDALRAAALRDDAPVKGYWLRRLCATARKAWAERDAVKRQLRTVQVELEAEHIRHDAIRAALGLEPGRDDTVQQAVEIRAAAPKPSGWVPVSLTGEPCWNRAAYTYDDAWLALILGEYYVDRQQAEGAGWRVVPCAAIPPKEVPHDAQ